MLDSKYLRQDIDVAAEQLNKRGYQLDVAKISALEEQRKTLQTRTQELQNQRKSAPKVLVKLRPLERISNLYWTK